MARRRSLEPRKKATQPRAQETVRALREAAARILASEGPDRLTTNRVAEVAGVGIGSLYQYFPNKAAIVADLVEHRLTEDTALLGASALALAEAPDPARALVDAVCDRQLEGAPLMAALLPLLSQLERDRTAREVTARLVEELGSALQATPERLAADLREPEALRTALFVVSRAIRWVTNEAIVERPDLLADEAFREELSRIARRLFAPVPPRGDIDGRTEE
ncbi:MAG: TetR/AcrR family transcriptional regulator [Alphaproteobacteria bacterium]|nr:TetR/AcrR family transcriptional regulator [Alphaproteobacteria bacterium]